MHTHSPIPRTALVTGGSSGIGLAIARRLRQQGYRIALVARDSQRLQCAAAELGGVPWMAADLSRREAVEAVAAWVGDTFQGLDVLVNNAGFTRKIAATTPLAEAEREWDALRTVAGGSATEVEAAGNTYGGTRPATRERR